MLLRSVCLGNSSPVSMEKLLQALAFKLLVYEGVQKMPQWYKDYFDLKTLKNKWHRMGLFLDSSYLPKKEPPQKNLTIFFPGEIATYHQRKVSITPKQTLSQNYCISYLFSLGIIYLSPKTFIFPEVPFSPSPFPIKMVYKLQILTSSLSHISLWTPYQVIKMFFFSLICPYEFNSQDPKNRT